MTLATVDLIVLVDDNRADNLYHRLVLGDCIPDVTVVAFESGASALDILVGSEAPGLGQALVLVDLNMPGMNGWEFIAEYRNKSRPSAGHLAVLSTTENPDEIARAYAHPEVDGFLSKPLSEAKLHALLA